MALGNERTIDDRDYPCSGLLATQPPEDSNSDGAVPVVPEEEEEEEADEFRAEPEAEEVEEARLRGAVGPKPPGVAE